MASTLKLLQGGNCFFHAACHRKSHFLIEVSSRSLPSHKDNQTLHTCRSDSNARWLVLELSLSVPEDRDEETGREKSSYQGNLVS